MRRQSLRPLFAHRDELFLNVGLFRMLLAEDGLVMALGKLRSNSVEDGPKEAAVWVPPDGAAFVSLIVAWGKLSLQYFCWEQEDMHCNEKVMKMYNELTDIFHVCVEGHL